VRRRAAEHIVAAVGGRFDVINGDGSDDDERHGGYVILDFGLRILD
jgi:hypothetical protein